MSEKIKTVKRFGTLFGIVGWIFVLAIVQVFIAPNSELRIGNRFFVENWGWGLIGIFIFGLLFVIPIKKKLFQPKKLWISLVMFSLCFIVVDWIDFTSYLGMFP